MVSYVRRAILKAIRSMGDEPPEIVFGDPSEWRNLRKNIARGSLDLEDIFRRKGPASEWEWAGFASPYEMTRLVTSEDPVSVMGEHLASIPRAGPARDYVLTHSHPGNLDKAIEGDTVTAPMDAEDPTGALSVGDMKYMLARALSGITAIEPRGSFGYAIRSPRSSGSSIEHKLHNLQNAIAEDLHAQRLKNKRNPVTWILPGENGAVSDRAYVYTMGLGNALREKGFLDRFGYVPATPGQAHLMGYLQPEIERAQKVGLDYLDEVYPGALAATLAAGVGGGGMALQDALANRLRGSQA